MNKYDRFTAAALEWVENNLAGEIENAVNNITANVSGQTDYWSQRPGDIVYDLTHSSDVYRYATTAVRGRVSVNMEARPHLHFRSHLTDDLNRNILKMVNRSRDEFRRVFGTLFPSTSKSAYQVWDLCTRDLGGRRAGHTGFRQLACTAPVQDAIRERMDALCADELINSICDKARPFIDKAIANWKLERRAHRALGSPSMSDKKMAKITTFILSELEAVKRTPSPFLVAVKYCKEFYPSDTKRVFPWLRYGAWFPYVLTDKGWKNLCASDPKEIDSIMSYSDRRERLSNLFNLLPEAPKPGILEAVVQHLPNELQPEHVHFFNALNEAPENANDCREVFDWFNACHADLDKNQLRAGWNSFVKRAQDWHAIQAAEKAEKDKRSQQWNGWLEPFKTMHKVEVEPLASLSSLVIEGQRQKHCIGNGGYMERGAKGRALYFSLVNHKGVRATLELTRNGNYFRQAQLRGKRNMSPDKLPKAIHRAVEIVESKVNDIIDE